MHPYTHYHYCATKPKQQWHAWVAGSCHWFLCHQRGRTKPCLHFMTSGELTCPFCTESDNPVSQSGYLPLYREVDGRPVMVVLHEYAREMVDTLRLHQRVIVGRGESQSDGTYVIPAPVATPRYQSSIPSRMRPADLTRTLLALWRIAELTDWYGRTHGASDNPVSMPKVNALEVAPQVDMMESAKVDAAARNAAFVASLKAQVGLPVASGTSGQMPNGHQRKKK